ncbi:MAG: hypothetical protein GY906_28885 [bacterium]|nr:hypothetical protein [bacterium]
MNPEDFLTEAESVRIWRQFFDRVHTLTRRLPQAERDDIRLEIASHLSDSVEQQDSSNETDRLRLAIGKLGDPEEFVRPMVADRLLTVGGRSMNPRAIAVAVYYSLYGGIRTTVLAIVVGLGYALSFTFAAMALGKILFPGHVGLFLNDDGPFILGGTLHPEAVTPEVLGWWIVPLATMTSIILYVGLSKALRLLKTTRSPPSL